MLNRRRRCLWPWLAIAAVVDFGRFTAAAQTNGLVNYQGRVQVGAALFNGAGQFKFAIVSSDGSQFYWRNSASSAPSGEPDNVITVGVTNGQYNVVLGDTTVANMAAIPLSVFSTGIGQIGSAPLYLRVWFNDGVHGSQALSPDQRFTPVGFSLASAFAQQAATVTPGAIGVAQLAPGTLNATNISGTLPNAALPPGLALQSDLLALSNNILGQIPAALNSLSNSLSARIATLQQQVNILALSVGGTNGGLPPGLAVASPNPADTTLIASGFQPFFNVPAQPWAAGNPAGQPAARSALASTWIGSKFLVFGGAAVGGAPLGDGGEYDPIADQWTAIPGSPLVAPRSGASLVWTGNQAIVWGGVGVSSTLNTGGILDTAAHAWVGVTPTNGAPSARFGHAAAWTGAYMAIWGGQDGHGGLLNDLSLFDPVAGAWLSGGAAAGGSPPVAAAGALGVWTGSSWLIWGGSGPSGAAGGILGLSGTAPGVWSSINPSGSPAPRTGHSAVWTGSVLLVWGGINGTGPLGDGAAYDPIANTWSAIPSLNAPTARYQHSAVWTGQEMIIAGGLTSSGPEASAFAYSPVTQTWRTLTTAGAPLARYQSVSTWTGDRILVFGGYGPGSAPIAALQWLNPQPAWYFYRHP
jgi:Kelch motif